MITQIKISDSNQRKHELIDTKVHNTDLYKALNHNNEISKYDWRSKSESQGEQRSPEYKIGEEAIGLPFRESEHCNLFVLFVVC